MSATSVLIAIGVIIFAYLIGSISFSVVFSKLFTGNDVRNSGSGNAGTTNVLRTAGKLPAALTFVCDALKGFVACLAGKLVFSYLYTLPDSSELFQPMYGAYICCLAVMLGHIFPVFFGFKGGKAVATSVGTFSICCPLAIVLGLTAFALCLIVSKIVSLSSIIATVTVVSTAIIYSIFASSTVDNFFFPVVNYNIIPTVIMTLIAGFIVIIKHKDNVVRLLNGTEKKISAKKKES